MKSLALVSLMASAVLAANPLIPSGISSSCTTFLTALDSDASLSACTTPLVSATSSFGPTSSSTGSVSSSTISSALSTICSSTSNCNQSTLRGLLTSFYGNCSAELTSNKDVIRTYDVLYSLIPFQQSVCTKDGSSNYCVANLNTTSSTSSAAVRLAEDSSPSSNLYTSVSASKRDDQVAFIPDTDTFSSNNIVYLYLSPSLSQSQLCTTCTLEVMTAWMAFESAVPYAPGLANSVLMSGQSALTSGIQKTCGSTFLSGATVAAGGGLSDGLVGGARSARMEISTWGSVAGLVVAMMLGLVTLF